jgi:hypothetical protein
MSPPTAATRPRQRRTRGGIMLPRFDGRTLAARRYKEIIQNLEAEVGTDLSEADRGLIKTAGVLELRHEQMEAALMRGELIDNDELIRIASERRRILAKLRSKVVKNKPPAGPTLDELFAAEEARAE